MTQERQTEADGRTQDGLDVGAETKPDQALRTAQEDRLRRTWVNPKGWRALFDNNNSTVGKWYIATAFGFFLFAGVLALMMRVQLAVPGNTFLSPSTYNQAMTVHGSAMMFLFAVPMFEAIAMLLMPQMLGARDLPFPRLSAFGYWCFLIGGVFFCGSILFDAAPSSGWFMYPPLATRAPGIGSDIWLLGLSFIEVASIAAAVELIVGVLKCRAPGMRINVIPLYAWYVLVVGVMILFAFPPLIAGDILFELERAFGWPFFDAAKGGDPVLWQHLFWIFGHPEVYIVFLPSIALAAMIVPTVARTPMFGYSWIVLSAVGTGFLSFGLWVHHMFATGLPAISLGFFSAASEAVAIPTGVQLFCFIGTLLVGRVKMSVPMLFIVGSFAIFVLGGLTGVMVAIAPFDWQAHDTYFVVAHLHYVLVGGMFFPVVAGIYYYAPIVLERTLSEFRGKIAFWMMLIGFNIGFLPMHVTGLRGMPRRVATYPAGIGLETLNMISTIGAFIFAAGIALIAFDVIFGKRAAKPVAHNPWDAGTLEWLPSIPAETWGLRTIPVVSSRYPLWDDPHLVERYRQGGYYLPDAEEGQRETLLTTVLDGKPQQVQRLPKPSPLPMAAAFALGGLFIFPTFHWTTAAALSGALALVLVIAWLWTGTAAIPEKPAKDIGLGETAPLYGSGSASIGWWAVFITMTGSSTGFASLVFAYFFYWTIHPQWPPAGTAQAGAFWPVIATCSVALLWVGCLAARKWNRNGRTTSARIVLFGAALATLASLAGLMLAPLSDGLDPTSHAYPATVWVLSGWAAAHLAVAVVMLLYCLARSLAGRMTSAHDIDLCNTTLFIQFAAPTALITLAVLYLFPLAS